MFDVFGSLKAIVKLDSVCTDNTVFRLHYKVTVIMLVAFSLLVTSRQYIGDPISCLQHEMKDFRDALNTYCWIHATFTVPEALSKKVGIEVPHPGVQQYVPGEERTYHKYYQWVCFMLFFQAMLFYIPRYVWKIWEGGKMKMLALELNCPMIEEDTKKDKKKLLIDYMVNHLHSHNSYVFAFALCEVLNFVIVIVNIYFVDLFLGGEFTTYGPDVIKFTEMDQEDRVDPMVRVFPRVTKCTFHMFGTSGDVQKYDTLCVLPLNIVNEKIYVMMWFWFVILAVISAVSLVYRALVIAWPKSRFYLLRARCRLAPRDYTEIVVRKSKVGDWFVLYLLSKNMDSFFFRDFITDLGRKIEGKELV